MSEVVNISEEVRNAMILKLARYFREPGMVDYTKEYLGKVAKILEIAIDQDSENPVEWTMIFDRSHPHILEIGSEDTRVGNLLGAAEIYLSDKRKAKERKAQKPNRLLDTNG